MAVSESVNESVQNTYKVKADLVNAAGELIEVKLSTDFNNKEEALAFATALLDAKLSVAFAAWCSKPKISDLVRSVGRMAS
jgi:ABC-type branched-subunit amino acid transport system substrate-binding protein